jgi:hypothetical protein
MKSHRTTEERRAVVKKMASLRLNHQEIASLLKISSKTLERRYRKEIEEGRAQARLSVEAVIYKRVTSNDKSIATANLQKWWMDRNYPVEGKDPGEQRPMVTITLPDNGSDHPSFRRHSGNQLRIVDATVNAEGLLECKPS